MTRTTKSAVTAYIASLGGGDAIAKAVAVDLRPNSHDLTSYLVSQNAGQFDACF
jgi:hypothetical protein